MERKYTRVKGRNRISEVQYYLNIAKAVAVRSTCLRRNYGAVIVRDKQIISTGYGGAPRNTANCTQIGNCVRQMLGAAKGEHYELCRAVHAEQNAIIHASRSSTMNATLYLCGLDYKTQNIDGDAEPCHICKRMIINAGITKVIVMTGEKTFRHFNVEKWVTRNLGEIKKVKGKWVPVIPKGYSYGHKL